MSGQGNRVGWLLPFELGIASESRNSNRGTRPAESGDGMSGAQAKEAGHPFWHLLINTLSRLIAPFSPAVKKRINSRKTGGGPPVNFDALRGSSTSMATRSYDYVIIGAGSAGCTLAR